MTSHDLWSHTSFDEKLSFFIMLVGFMDFFYQNYQKIRELIKFSLVVVLSFYCTMKNNHHLSLSWSSFIRAYTEFSSIDPYGGVYSSEAEACGIRGICPHSCVVIPLRPRFCRGADFFTPIIRKYVSSPLAQSLYSMAPFFIFRVMLISYLSKIKEL